MADWDTRFMHFTRHIAKWSKDRSRKVGCVIVGPDHEVRAIGYNGFPRGANDNMDYRHERPAKYRWTEHAERNAICNAARVGTPLKACSLYVNWYPCMDCARAIVQAGINDIIAIQPDLRDPQWGDDFQEVRKLFSETCTAVRIWEETSLKEEESGVVV